MDIKETLSKLKKWELEDLARQLKLTGFHNKNKRQLIVLIENTNKQQITAALNGKSVPATDPPWWKSPIITRLLAIAGLVGLIGTFATIIALFLTIEQEKGSKGSKKILQSISKQLENYDPIKRDQIVKQLVKVNEELKAVLNDERLGITKVREKALEALNNGNPTKAKELYLQQFEKEKNKLAEKYFNQGNLFYHDSILIGYDSEWAKTLNKPKNEKALKAYKKAIEIKPNYHKAWNNKGVVLSVLGRNKDALQALNKAIRIKPDYLEAWLNKWHVLSAMGRLSEAMAAYSYVLRMNPNYNGRPVFGGITMSGSGSKKFLLSHLWNETMQTYSETTEIKPEDAKFWNNKGLTLAVLGRNDEALHAYNKAIEIESDYHEAWNNKGAVFSELGRNDEALKTFNKAIEIKPDYYQAWNNKSKALSALGRNDEAQYAYNKAMEIKPDYAKSWNNKGLTLAALRRNDEALHAYNEAIEIKPDYHEAWNNKGAALYALGRKDDALQAFNKVIEIKPDHEYAWNNKGVTLDDLGQKKEAQKAFDKAKEIQQTTMK